LVALALKNTAKKEGVGKYNSTVFYFRTEQGIEYSVWGTTMVVEQMDQAALGQKLRIQWNGMKQKKDKSGHYHDFEVFEVTGTEPLNTAELASAAPNVEVAETKQEVMANEKANDDLPF